MATLLLERQTECRARLAKLNARGSSEFAKKGVSRKKYAPAQRDGLGDDEMSREHDVVDMAFTATD